MPEYQFPWKDKLQLFNEYLRQPEKTFNDFTTPGTQKFLVFSVTTELLEPEEDYKRYIKEKDGLSTYFKYAIARVIADLKDHNARQGLDPSHLERLNQCIDNAILDVDRNIRDLKEKNQIKEITEQQAGDILFPHVEKWAFDLNSCFRVEENDKKPASANSIKPFLKNLALNLTGIGFFAFIYSCGNKLFTGQYAFFDDQLITDKLEQIFGEASDSVPEKALDLKYYDLDLSQFSDEPKVSPESRLQQSPVKPYAGSFALSRVSSQTSLADRLQQDNDSGHTQGHGRN